MLNFLDGYKTYLAALGIVITALVGYLNGATTISDTILLILNGLGLASVRHAVSKS